MNEGWLLPHRRTQPTALSRPGRSREPGGSRVHDRRFRQGLRERGYVEGQNLAIEYRFSEDRSRSTLPKGQIFHAAGATPGGWTIVAIHESKESWERSRAGILRPRLQQGIKGGCTTPPQETVFDIHNMQQ